MTVPEKILGAVAGGAITRREIVLATGLDAGIVDAAVDVLMRTGQLPQHQLRPACGGGCGQCRESGSCEPRSEIVQLRQR